ncbi:MAG: HIT domain-containing protein [Candidatus Omnitrophica bacterium]|nr:HIT domain-containing protein [Candidatus Omnitrophota bacterium]
MKRLWAPWRKAYIRPKKPSASRGCLFCRVQGNRQNAKNLVLRHNPSCFAILNLYPYNNGHVLIVPNRHVNSIAQLSAEEKLDWLALTTDVIDALKNQMNAQGFNVGLNLGAAAGAGIPDHLHLHIVPRWAGDHNFMPVLAGAKVISESLQSAYETLRIYLNSGKTKK